MRISLLQMATKLLLVNINIFTLQVTTKLLLGKQICILKVITEF